MSYGVSDEKNYEVGSEEYAQIPLVVNDKNPPEVLFRVWDDPTYNHLAAKALHPVNATATQRSRDVGKGKRKRSPSSDDAHSEETLLQPQRSNPKDTEGLRESLLLPDDPKVDDAVSNGSVRSSTHATAPRRPVQVNAEAGPSGSKHSPQAGRNEIMRKVLEKHMAELATTMNLLVMDMNKHMAMEPDENTPAAEADRWAVTAVAMAEEQRTVQSELDALRGELKDLDSTS